MAGEVTLADQRALLAANVAAARSGQAPVAVERIIDVTINELKSAGLTAVDSVVGFAREKPGLTVAAAVGVAGIIGLVVYLLRRSGAS